MLVASGDWHSAAVSEDGDLYTWGCNTEGQLGHSTEELSCVAMPVRVEFSSKVASVACGTWHTVALTSELLIFVFSLFQLIVLCFCLFSHWSVVRMG